MESRVRVTECEIERDRVSETSAVLLDKGREWGIRSYISSKHNTTYYCFRCLIQKIELNEDKSRTVVEERDRDRAKHL